MYPHHIAKSGELCVVFQFQAFENGQKYMVLYGGSTKKSFFLKRPVVHQTRDQKLSQFFKILLQAIQHQKINTSS